MVRDLNVKYEIWKFSENSLDYFMILVEKSFFK